MKIESKKVLPIAAIVVISGAMFSSHFGVGDLIFPPILGRDSGTSFGPCIPWDGTENPATLRTPRFSLHRSRAPFLPSLEHLGSNVPFGSHGSA